MSQGMKYVDINMKIDKNYLHVRERTILQIDIINKSDTTIENGLFQLKINDELFSVLNDTLSLCVNEFASVGNIAPGKSINLNIPLLVESVPDNFFTKIGSNFSFHVVEEGQLLDLNYTDNSVSVNFFEVCLLENDTFKIRSLKDKYLLDENIEYEILIKNEGKHPVTDLVVSDFIPPNAKLIPSSIITSNPIKAVANIDTVEITDLNVLEEIYITFSVELNEKDYIEFLENKAHLKYTDRSGLVLESDARLYTTQINNSTVYDNSSFIYTVDKQEAFINDIVNHTITIKNTSYTTTKNLYLKGSLIKQLSFVENSLIVNDIYRVNESITDDIALGELDPSEELTITYQTKVLDLFDSVNLDVFLSYDTPKRTLSQRSNSVFFKVMSPVFKRENFTKKTDKDNYVIGEIVEFTIELLNEGNIPAEDVLLRDVLNSSLSFIPNSVFVDNFKVETNITENGALIKTIEPYQKVTIKYKARAMDVSRSEKECAYITYSLATANTPETIYSNETSVSILGAKIGSDNFKKELSTYTAQVGDVITARLYIENKGTIDCENLKIYEPINSALEFVDGSLKINNKEIPDENIFNGVIWTKLKQNESLTVTYQIKILDFPRPNPIDDRAVLNYTCIHNDKIENKNIYSTKTKLYINNPDLDVVDKHSFSENGELHKYCHFNDHIFYNLILENKGNVPLENITLNFSFPEDLCVDIKTLKINNEPYTKPLENNIVLPNLNISQVTRIEFYVKHNFLGKYNLDSFVNFNYTFRDLKSNEVLRKCKNVKENIIVINPNLEINKFISDKDIELHREFTKNINIKNSGNVKLENVVLNLNENEFLKVSNKTVFVNGIYTSFEDVLVFDSLNINESVNISIRYTIDDIPIFENVISESEVSATYQFYKGYSPITIKRKSNKITLDIKNYFLEVRGKCSANTLTLDETYTYFFKITNIGNVNCETLKLNLQPPDCIDYVENSFKINGKKINIKKISSAIILGSLSYNETLNVSFDFVVNELPYNKQIKINGLVTGKYNLDGEYLNKEFQSSDTILNVENIDIEIIKSASSDTLQSGETLKIQTIINNVGSLDVHDLVLRDNEEENLVFVEESVYIDGENMINFDPTLGINMNDLPSGRNILVSYEYEYLPRSRVSKISHFSDLQYSYNLGNNKERIGHLKSDTTYIEGSLSTFKQFSMQNEYTLKSYEPDIGEIVSFFSNATVEDYYEISSIKNRSIDNSNSTGKKVIVKGYVMDRVEYLTKDDNTPLYMLERTQPFNVYINLPSDYHFEDLYFKAKCDDTFYKTVGSRGVFISSLISIEGLI